MIPSVSPTVPIADAVSNRQVMSGRDSTVLMTIAPMTNRERYRAKMVDAILTVWSLIRLEKAEDSSRCRNVPRALRTSTAIVVVFMPPAVEPGEPPISIRMMLINFPESENAAKSVVLKPAVLVVTDWKSEARIR